VGCDAVDADSSWLRLHLPGGHLRTLDWTGISMAALVRNDERMTFEGDLGQITALRSSHDPLWIESGDAVAIALLEKQHAKREAILAMFPQRLGARWLGDTLTAEEAAMRMFKIPTPGSAGFPKIAILAIAAIVLMLLAVFVASRSNH
jgi:hypothetical protein